jgi:hypothetical protein
VRLSSKPNSHRCATIPSLFPQHAGTSVELTITHPTDCGQFVSGFLHLWAKYVRGFNRKVHCQTALLGPLSSLVKTKSTRINTKFFLNETRNFDSLYICGVAEGPIAGRRANNLHLPLLHRVGAQLLYTTYNGYLLHVENAIILRTPELPRGWNGLPETYTRCRNFRFCVDRFGYPARSSEADALQNTRQGDSIGKRSQTGFLGRRLDAPLDPVTSPAGDRA